MTPDFKHIEAAREGFQNLIHPSPMIRSGYFSRLMGADIFLKLENLQETGSFKVRGAYNRISALSPEEKKRGVIAASAGNHAQGVAWAAARLGISATIVMPGDWNPEKQDTGSTMTENLPELQGNQSLDRSFQGTSQTYLW